ncbi:MAG: hypothetical protein ACI4JN_07590, partial [Ruminococcus sp.]
MKKLLSLMLAAAMTLSFISAEISVDAEKNLLNQSVTQASTETEFESTNTFGNLLTQEIDVQT